MSMKRLTHDRYAEKLKAAHPRYELLSQYTTARGKIKVRCCMHGETYDVQAQSLTTTGQSLKCCGKDRSRAATQRSVLRAKANLADKIAKHGRLELISSDNYKNQRSKVLCKCLTCGEQAMLTADNATMGQGINCICHLQIRIANGKKTWTPELVAKAVEARQLLGISNPHDSVELALKGDVLPGSCSLYLYESPVKGLAKFGIAKVVEKRARQEGYGKPLVEPRTYASRVQAILIEQAYKYGFGVKAPAELSNWCGKTELTDSSPEEFEEQVNDLERALLELGSEQFAIDYCGVKSFA